MNKLLIGLLVVAVGAGVYFLLLKKEGPIADNEFKKEWIVGKWKTTSQEPVKDVQSMPQYEFFKDGSLLRSVSDTVKADSLHYEWSKDRELTWKTSSTDSSGTVFVVLKLNKDSLLLQGKDSVQTLYSKAK